MKKEITLLPIEEVTEIKSQITVVQEASNLLVISSKSDLDMASELLRRVKQVEKSIEERKTQITRPLMESLASIRGLFAPLETAHKLATKTIKEKMLAYTIEEEDRIQKEKVRISKRVEKGTMRADTASEKLDAVGTAPKSNVREVTKVRIVDETAIPREYMVPNMIMITEAIIRNGQTVSGVETYIEKSIVTPRSN